MSDHEAMESRISEYNERTDPARGIISLAPLARDQRIVCLEQQVEIWKNEAYRVLQQRNEALDALNTLRLRHIPQLEQALQLASALIRDLHMEVERGS